MRPISITVDRPTVSKSFPPSGSTSVILKPFPQLIDDYPIIKWHELTAQDPLPIPISDEFIQELFNDFPSLDSIRKNGLVASVVSPYSHCYGLKNHSNIHNNDTVILSRLKFKDWYTFEMYYFSIMIDGEDGHIKAVEKKKQDTLSMM